MADLKRYPLVTNPLLLFVYGFGGAAAVIGMAVSAKSVLQSFPLQTVEITFEVTFVAVLLVLLVLYLTVRRTGYVTFSESEGCLSVHSRGRVTEIPIGAVISASYSRIWMRYVKIAYVDASNKRRNVRFIVSFWPWRNESFVDKVLALKREADKTKGQD